jgi:phosphatidylglycerophosphate synthase
MFDIPLRQVKDRLLLPLVPLLPRSITPNGITFLAFLFGLLACFTAATPSLISWAVYPWFVNRLLDNLDGALARSRRVSSELGGFLDLLSDFIVYSLLPISISYGQYRLHGGDEGGWLCGNSFLAITTLEATFHVNNFVLFYIAAVSATKQERELTSLTMKPALVEGFESGLIFTAMLIWPGHVVSMSWVMSLGVVLGTIQRVSALVVVLRNLEGSKEKRLRSQ